jgi:hypothetical protein
VPTETPPIARTIRRWMQASGLGKTKIYELINRGELPVVRIDNCTLILDEDMAACLRRHRQFRGSNGSPSAPPDVVEPPPQSSTGPVGQAVNNFFNGGPSPAAPPPVSARADELPRRRRGRPAKSAARSPPK